VVLQREYEAESADKYLCAYIVSTPLPEGNPAEVTGLRDYLSKKLPAYMIPAYFIQLEQIPLTPSGKIDRKTLNSLEIQLNTAIEYAAPKSNNEKIIAQTWKDVLNRDRVGINDNFFDLGGNSFNMIQIIGKLREVFDMNISMVSMFEYPTIRAFARYVSSIIPGENPDDKDMDKHTDTGITKKIERSKAFQAGQKSKLKQQARRKRRN
jgi:acyl carrier protein